MFIETMTVNIYEKLIYSLLFRSKYKIIGDGFRKSISIQEIKKLHEVFLEKMTLKIYKKMIFWGKK